MKTVSVRTHGPEDLATTPQPRLAYLLSIYPAVSHTFFLNEIAALRRLGFAIDVASINRPEAGAGPASPLEAGEMETTFYLKAMSPARIAWQLLKTLFGHPLVVLRGFSAAMQLDRWNPRATGYALLYLGEALLVGDWLRQRGHRHLHIHFGGPVATVGMLAAISWQFSYSLMIHGPEEFYDVEKFYLRRKVEEAQFVLCISDYCRSQVMKVSDPSHWTKLHVVRLGVDLGTFEPAAAGRSQEGDQEDDQDDDQDDDGKAVEIICVGRLVAAKGHLILLGAFSSLRNRGYNVRLQMIGDGEERGAIESFIRQEQLEDRVLLHGALNHQATRQKLLQADIFVLASFAEGVPVALMEAMAMQIPCVSTYVAGIPELIRDGMEGLLVPPSSQPALAAALETLIVSAELRRRLGASGRSRVTDLYNLQKNTRYLADVFEKCLAPAANKVT